MTAEGSHEDEDDSGNDPDSTPEDAAGPETASPPTDDGAPDGESSTERAAGSPPDDGTGVDPPTAGGEAVGDTARGPADEEALATAMGDLRRSVALGTAGALAGTILLWALDAVAGAGTLAGLAELVGAGPEPGVGAAVFFGTTAVAWSALFSTVRPYLPGDRRSGALGLAAVLWIVHVAALALVVPGAVGSLPVAAVGVLLAFGAYGAVLGRDYDRLVDRLQSRGST